MSVETSTISVAGCRHCLILAVGKLSRPFYKDCTVLPRVWRKVKEKLLLGLEESVPSIFQQFHGTVAGSRVRRSIISAQRCSLSNQEDILLLPVMSLTTDHLNTFVQSSIDTLITAFYHFWGLDKMMLFSLISRPIPYVAVPGRN